VLDAALRSTTHARRTQSRPALDRLSRVKFDTRLIAAREPSTRYTLADGATGFPERLEGLIQDA
jgi:hypothetical protein